jgi:hypothetical protein
MPRDWSGGAHDDLVVDARLARMAQPSALADLGSRGAGAELGLPLKCVLAGVMAALVYVWPVLLVVDIMAGGFRPALFGLILAGSAVLASLAFWTVTVFERRYWARNVRALSEFADPPP